MLATPEATELLDWMDGERLTCTWKFDKGRGKALGSHHQFNQNQDKRSNV